MPSPFDQSTYQVRLEWGVSGLHRLAPTDVVIAVDVLRFSSTVADAVAAGATIDLDGALRWSTNGAAVTAAATADTVLVGGIRNAAAVARAVQVIQGSRGRRTSVAVIAAGELDDAGAIRFAVEDHLGAGAIVAALTDLGIDHTSPEAAAAAESFRSLRGALRHLLGASGSGRELEIGVASTARMEAAGIVPTSTEDAATLDAVSVVPMVDRGRIVAFDG
ncbi:2-phosphosulfolactate phosphatase [Microbacterium sp.]|uniref:2-phosphosulfolactate phosphatase n=1 Tax=Microbacterium sp. TaxID=51671 RepID=UPI002811C4A2|nr:2-phosphosulfolactate phosphatase [Microbacterium sp.]